MSKPSPAEIDAATRVLYEEASFYNWWPMTTTSYDQFAATDPVGLSELSGIAERILAAAARARWQPRSQ